MNPLDEQSQRRARLLYRHAAQQIDSDTAARLRQARGAALARAQRPTSPRLPKLLLPAGAFAVLALASLILWQPSGPRAPAGEVGAAPGIATVAAPIAIDGENALPPDADAADPRLYQNLDFYGWLASNHATERTNR